MGLALTVGSSRRGGIAWPRVRIRFFSFIFFVVHFESLGLHGFGCWLVMCNS